MAHRYDRGTLKPANVDSAGFLRADAFVTRTGVFQYQCFDGSIVREYRPPAEVFKPESLATFDRIPVTDDHPPVMVNATNATAYAKGTTGEKPAIEGTYVACSLVVYDQALIDKMHSGKVQVSIGYDCDVVFDAGISPEGEPYDAYQTNIIANHVAIVDAGRAGPGASVRMDNAAFCLDENEYGLTAASRADESELEKWTMDELKKALADLALATARADSAEAKLKTTSDTLERAEGERDALKAANAKAEQARMDAINGVGTLVKERVKLETQVAGLVDGDLSALSDRDIRVAAIKKVDNVDIPAAKSDEYVTARFDSCMERSEATVNALAGVRGAIIQSRTDGLSEEDKARAEMLANNKAAFNAMKRA